MLAQRRNPRRHSFISCSPFCSLMCGIVGYIGPNSAAPRLIAGLRKLEYRGYDSSGIALIAPVDGKNEILLRREVGKIDALQRELDTHPLTADATVGIGHTRWATHGVPSVRNAHPHLSRNGRIAVVHNGIIDNYQELRAQLMARGFEFRSETDTEVLAHLIELNSADTLVDSVRAALRHVQGTFGIAVVSADFPDEMIVARRGSPIVIGSNGTETLVASDVAPIVPYTTSVTFLDDGDIAILTPGRFEIRSLSNTSVSREPTSVDWDPGAAEKGGFEHFMLKEIFEQPEALENCLRGRLIEADGAAKLSGLRLEPRDIASLSNLVVTACGTSYYAGLHGSYAFEQLAGIPARIEQAAEFRYRNPIVSPDTGVIAISQSGETADTLAAVREAARKGALVCSICNVVGSTIAREAGRGIYLHAGPEIGVASTKAFLCQVAVLNMMALLFGRTRRLCNAEGICIVRAMQQLPNLVRSVLAQNDRICAIAEKIAGCTDAFYIGRGYMYPAALEGALKLKEISYLHAEGYHAAELKHGPIALLDEHVPVIACAPSIPGHDKTMGNIQECRARKAPVIVIASEGDESVSAFTEDVIRIPACHEIVAAIPVVVAEQLLAYHVARLRGEPIDQPRNLAKSVTVE